eukprot:UN24820
MQHRTKQNNKPKRDSAIASQREKDNFAELLQSVVASGIGDGPEDTNERKKTHMSTKEKILEYKAQTQVPSLHRKGSSSYPQLLDPIPGLNTSTAPNSPTLGIKRQPLSEQTTIRIVGSENNKEKTVTKFTIHHPDQSIHEYVQEIEWDLHIKRIIKEWYVDYSFYWQDVVKIVKKEFNQEFPDNHLYDLVFDFIDEHNEDEESDSSDLDETSSDCMPDNFLDLFEEVLIRYLQQKKYSYENGKKYFSQIRTYLAKLFTRRKWRKKMYCLQDYETESGRKQALRTETSIQNKKL